jgi:hypothetical protein
MRANLTGGGGYNELNFLSNGTAININLATGVNGGALGGETFNNIQEVVGSGLGDTITLGNNTSILVPGTSYNGWMQESAGNNTLIAGAGRAEIYGGTGNDTNVITGGGTSPGTVACRSPGSRCPAMSMPTFFWPTSI